MSPVAIICTVFVVIGLLVLGFFGLMAFIALIGAISEADDSHDMFNDYKD